MVYKIYIWLVVKKNILKNDGVRQWVLSVENGSPSSKLDYQRELANKRISAKASVVTPFVGQVQVEFVQRLTLQQEKTCIKLLSNQPQYRYSPNSTWKHNKNPKIRIEMM